MFNGIATDYDDSVISSTGFWGNVSVRDFQKTRAIPMQIPVEMIKSVLLQAMQALEYDLSAVVLGYQAQGYTRAEDVPSATIGGLNHIQALYQKAVFARAKADLLPEFLTLSARDVHENRDLVKEQKSLLSEAAFAIRTLKGKKRGGVWLL
ncbi:head completion/stabilization protein [Pasteurellaceae bacterium 20609_3]|uniref:head completion/stabilization protein n=1 Tax=Spirabiliibacterium mucosae TaxID=28156 RepID=UPI001AACD0B7|nr:head completion/stabilization protein [Spirabiliibacterium mucosae]MBE2898613.1 head completion/stabilization protein [Spirabiliibacterium mucosae]